MLEGNTIWLKQIFPITEIHIRCMNEIIIFEENPNNVVIVLKLLSSMNKNILELHFGNKHEKKYTVLFPLKNFEQIARELQPLFNYLPISQI